jgi:hypothetical protein
MADQDRYRLQKGGRRGKLPAKRAGGSAGWQMSKADLRNLDSACRGITAPGAAWRGTGTSGWRRLELRKRRRKAASINRDVGRFTLLSHVVDIPAGIYPFHGPDGAAARLAHERLNVTRIETGTAVVAFVAARGTQSIDPSLLAAAGNRGVAFADQTTRPGGLPKENAPNLLQADPPT